MKTEIVNTFVIRPGKKGRMLALFQVSPIRDIFIRNLSIDASKAQEKAEAFLTETRHLNFVLELDGYINSGIINNLDVFENKQLKIVDIKTGTGKTGRDWTMTKFELIGQNRFFTTFDKVVGDLNNSPKNGPFQVYKETDYNGRTWWKARLEIKDKGGNVIQKTVAPVSNTPANDRKQQFLNGEVLTYPVRGNNFSLKLVNGQTEISHYGVIMGYMDTMDYVEASMNLVYMTSIILENKKTNTIQQTRKQTGHKCDIKNSIFNYMWKII